MTKDQARAYVEKLADDEPCFIIRAQDQLAPKTVLNWAASLYNLGGNADKVRAAHELASHMETWQRANFAKVPD